MPNHHGYEHAFISFLSGAWQISHEATGRLLAELDYVNSRLKPSFGIIQNAVGSVCKSCRSRPPPAHAVAFHRLQFGNASQALPDSSESMPKFASAPKKRTRAHRHYANPSDMADFDQIVEEHMNLMDSQPFSLSDPFGGSSNDSVSARPSGLLNHCLVDALRNLAVPVSIDHAGPFRARAHGNTWLAPFNLTLVLVSRPDMVPGRWVLWRQRQDSPDSGHFVAVSINDGQCTVLDGASSHVVEEPLLAEGPLRNLWWRLERQLSPEQLAVSQRNCALALERRTTRLLGARDRTQSSYGTTLTPEQLVRIANNRQAALRRRCMGLRRPTPPASWVSPVMPNTPTDWVRFDVHLPEVCWLATLNAHVRDRRLRFFADTHTYLLDGQPTLGSVTGLVHAFAAPFEELAVISKMMWGSRWPREGYMRLPASTGNRYKLILDHTP
jgi:hypothetical protein